MFYLLRLLITTLLPMTTMAQVDLSNGWKFRTGDDPSWATPGLDESTWKPIEVGHQWETQGYPGYDGYAWYRLHLVIPSSLKHSSYLKESIRLALGKIDDGDEVFLNGKLVGENGGKSKDITEGNWELDRIYTISLNDPCIHWDQDNVLAVRVYDHGGDGGMWEGPYTLTASDVNDYVRIEVKSTPFRFRTPGQARKNIAIVSTDPHYVFSGTMAIMVEDPSNGTVVWRKTVPIASVTPGTPFRYVYNCKLPSGKSYEAFYTFRDKKSNKQVVASEGIPYILTPPAPASPRINGAAIVGVRPGHPFLFKVPVTGVRPMRYAATDLPAGITIDPATGVLSGKAGEAGTYVVHLSASNQMGKANRDLKIVVGDQIALTPALGWNSWNCWGLSVNDAKVRAAADAMNRSGLINHGWTYINMDDGWERDTRNPQGEVVPNNKFPDMAKMTAYVHSLGLRVGIYSSPGPKTCGGFLGSYQHEVQDANTYANWGIDYLKYDWCSYGDLFPKPSLDDMKKPYQVMAAALAGVNRDILFSFCQYGMGNVWEWGGATGGNSWRTTGDINDSWSSMSGIGFRQDVCAPFTKPGNWNDPDMLVVGKVGWGPSLHNTHLTPDEQYTHISLWCLLSAPLLIGCDMSQMDDFTLNLLSNDEVLAIDQDADGKPARKAIVDGDIQVWTKPLSDGTLAVGIFNLGSKATQATVSLSDLGLYGAQVVRDCWRQRDLGTFTGVYTPAQMIPSHGVLLVRVRHAKD
ncbi:putative Ig domain-containing protein [Dinghuibacter silviterrae]|uniref:Alpha-galactosidase n=2 Tax=Dinghuibacter silviterrae TaxID=1539049 RepID=A0A4R8DN49_9BACT|nr:putative Ig domain-containing protein [Dinghuibacter silviterrae]